MYGNNFAGPTRAQSGFVKRRIYTAAICVSVLLSWNLTAANKQKTEIAVLFSGMKEERYQHDRKLFLKLAPQYNFKIKFASADNDSAIQLEKAKRLLDEGVKLLILQPTDDDRSQQIASLYQKHHIPLITYDRKLSMDFGQLHIGHDDSQAGSIQALAALKHGKPIKGVLICAGQRDHSVAKEMTQSILDIMARHHIKPLVKYHKNWSKDECKATVLKYFNRKPFNVVLANNSQMAAGAIEVLDILAPSDRSFFVAGSDGTTEACRNISLGKQSIDIHKPLNKLVKASLDLAQSIIARQQPKRHPPIAVTGLDQSNLHQYYLSLDSKQSSAFCQKKTW